MPDQESRVATQDATLGLAYWTAIAALVALAVLCVLWEGVLAPIRADGSWLVLKALPLLWPLFGLLRERVITYKWTLLLALVYFTEGVVRAWSDRGLAQQLAGLEVALSLLLFAACALYVRLPRRAQA
jgi:uncharacterized membrane protein